MNGPPHAALLHREAEAKNRSTVLSINSMMAFLAFGVAGPLLGLMADRVSLASRHGDGRRDQHPRGVLLPARTARREGSQPAPSRG